MCSRSPSRVTTPTYIVLPTFRAVGPSPKELDGSSVLVSLTSLHPITRFTDSQKPHTRAGSRSHFRRLTHAGIGCADRVGGLSGRSTTRRGCYPYARVEPQPCTATSRPLLLHGSALIRSQTRAVLGERERVAGDECGTWICQRKRKAGRLTIMLEVYIVFSTASPLG